MGDTEVKMKINTIKHQKSEFIMKVGRHEAKVSRRLSESPSLQSIDP